MNNKNYRVMKFFEPVNKHDNSRGYVRLDIRGIKGNIIVSVENLGDAKTTSEVYLYKDRTNKIKLGDINSKKGMLKKILTFGSNNAIEDYNICAVVKDKKIAMYSNLFNTCSQDQIRKLEADEPPLAEENIKRISDTEPEMFPKAEKPSVESERPSEEAAEKFKEAGEEAEAEKEETAAKREETEAKKEKNEAKEVKKEKTEVKKKETEVKHEEEKGKKAEADTLKEEKSKAETAPEDDRIKSTTVSSAVDISEEASRDEKNTDSEETKAQARKFKNKFDESLYNVLNDYKQVEPLSVKIKDFCWWYIPYDETGVRNGFLPYYSQIISSYYPYPMSNRVTTCSRLMEKYGHYIFGIYTENGDIVRLAYGVPGEFTREEQPYKGITGFKNWSYSNKENKGKHGYWLAFVNPKTGETTEPPQIVLS